MNIKAQFRITTERKQCWKKTNTMFHLPLLTGSFVFYVIMTAWFRIFTPSLSHRYVDPINVNLSELLTLLPFNWFLLYKKTRVPQTPMYFTFLRMIHSIDNWEITVESETIHFLLDSFLNDILYWPIKWPSLRETACPLTVTVLVVVGPSVLLCLRTRMYIADVSSWPGHPGISLAIHLYGSSLGITSTVTDMLFVPSLFFTFKYTGSSTLDDMWVKKISMCG